MTVIGSVKFLEAIEKIPKEALAELFDPRYGLRLNCSLEEHVLRNLAYTYLEQGGASTDLIQKFIVGTTEGCPRCENTASVPCPARAHKAGVSCEWCSDVGRVPPKVAEIMARVEPAT